MKLAGTCSFIHQLLQRRHQRLDLVRLAHQRVPEQEADRRAHHQHHEGAQRARAVARFEVQVEGRGEPAEQHEHFVQVADRDVADVRARSGGSRTSAPWCRSAPCVTAAQARREPISSIASPCRAAEEADPVEQRAHEEQHAHPEDGRLARQEVLEPEHACRRAPGRPGRKRSPAAQRRRPPAPARAAAARTSRARSRPASRASRMHLLVDVHRTRRSARTRTGRRPRPARRRSSRRQLRRENQPSCSVRVVVVMTSMSLIPSSLLLAGARIRGRLSMRLAVARERHGRRRCRRVACAGASHTHSRRSRTYSIAKTPTISNRQPR